MLDDGLKKSVLKTITDAIIKKPERKVLLSKLKGIGGILTDAGFPETIYENMALRQWLETYFKYDIYIDIGAGPDFLFYIGKDHPQARTRAVIPSMVRHYTEKVSSPTAKGFIDYIDKVYDISMSDYCGRNEDPIKWINNILEHSAPEKEAPTVVPLIHCWNVLSRTVYLTGLDQKLQTLLGTMQYPTTAGELKNQLALSYAESLFFGKDLVISGEFNGKPLLLFPIKPLDKDMPKLYCILEENVSKNDRSFQYWRLYDFYCPDAKNAQSGSDPVFDWAAAQLNRSGVNALNIRSLQTMVKELNDSGKQLSDAMSVYLEDVRSGCVPKTLLAEQVSEYEKLWQGLEQAYYRYFKKTMAPATALEELSSLFASNESVHTTFREAVGQFCRYLDSFDAFYKKLTGTEDACAASADAKVLSDLLASDDIQAGLPLTKELIGYYTVFAGITITDVPQKKLVLLQSIKEHFGLKDGDVFAVLGQLSFQKAEDLAFISDIEQISALITRYESELQSIEKAKAPRIDVSAEEILEMRIRDTGKFTREWTSLMQSVYPEETQYQELISSLTSDEDSEDTSSRLTPFDAGMILYANFGNADQTAEKYFLLSSVVNEAQATKQLLQLYREGKEYDKFLLVWEDLNGKAYASADDLIFMLEVMLNQGKKKEMPRYLYDLLLRDPDIRNHPAYTEFMRSEFVDDATVSNAFRMWCEKGAPELNAFEQALADKQLDKIYAMLDSEETMREMGYSDQQIEDIKFNLRTDLPDGISDLARGIRIFSIQGNHNQTAEKFFWNAASNGNNKQALIRLFDIYCTDEDWQSVYWLVAAMNVPIKNSTAMKLQYANALLKLDKQPMLYDLAVQYPDILRDEEIRRAVSLCEQEETPAYDLRGIISLQPEQSVLCPFEKALLSGDTEQLRAYAEDAEQMESWGYSADDLQTIRTCLQSSVITTGSDFYSMTERIWNYQGNLHGFYESLLYSVIDTAGEWFLTKLNTLLFVSGRYEELILFYDAYTDAYTDEQSIRNYLLSLIQTGRIDRLLESTRGNLGIIARNSELRTQLKAACEANGKGGEFCELEKKLLLIPVNSFEECLFRYDESSLQAHLNDRQKLIGLGYSEEQVDHFAYCCTKPYEKTDLPFDVACRIRRFLGDSRALQFFLNIESVDPRAAKVLFDIYMKEKRYDDICFLYRRNAEDVWNDHYSKLYVNALTKAVDPENCDALVKLISSWPADLRSGADTIWHYLRALIGSHQPIVRITMQEDIILENKGKLVPELVSGCFELAWQQEQSIKENIVSFASKLLAAFAGELTFGTRKVIAGINERLIDCAEREEWLRYIRENNLSDILFELNSVYAFGLPFDEDKTVFTAVLSEKLSRCIPEKMNADALNEYYTALVSCRPEEGYGNKLYADFVMQLIRFTLTKARSGLDEEKKLCILLLSSIDVAAMPAEYRIKVLDTVSDFIDADDMVRGAERLFGSMVSLLSKATEPENGDGGEDTPELTASADRLGKKLSVLFEKIITSSPDYFGTFSVRTAEFINGKYVSDDQLDRISQKLTEDLSNTADQAAQFRSLTLLPERLKLKVGKDNIFNLLLSYITDLNLSANEAEELNSLRDVLGINKWSDDELKTIMKTVAENHLLKEQVIFDKLRELCAEASVETKYELYKIIYREEIDISGLISPAEYNGDIMSCARELPPEQLTGAEDIELFYQAVQQNCTKENLALLQSIYAEAGFDDQRYILSVLTKFYDPETAVNAVDEVRKIFDSHTIDWIELYAKWWKNLIAFTDDDTEAKKRLPYLNEESVLDEGITVSLVKLMLGDIYDRVCLKICQYPALGFSDAAKRKFKYLSVVSDFEDDTSFFRIVTITQNMFKSKDFEMGIPLLRRLLKMPIANSAVVGQMLGDVYTAENVATIPALTEITDEVFEGIAGMNRTDPQGVWKNNGRGVEIALLTGREMRLFDITGPDMFRNHPGHCSVVIASLLLQGRVEDAVKWHEKAYPCNPTHQYLSIEDSIIRGYLAEGELSYAGRLFLDSIPPTGNNRSLEAYGKMVFTAISDGHAQDCLDVLLMMYDYSCNDRAYLLPLMKLFVLQEQNEETIARFYEFAKKRLRLESGKKEKRLAAFIFTAADTCLYTTAVREASWADVVKMDYLNTEDPAQGQAVLNDLSRFKEDCEQFLMDTGSRERLLRFVTGSWGADVVPADLYKNHRELFRTLAALNPECFAAACFAALIDGELSEKQAQAVLKEVHPVCAQVLSYVGEIENDKKDAAVYWLRIPLDVPGITNLVFRDIIDDAGTSVAPITTLFFAALSYTYAMYVSNVFGFKEYTEKTSAAYAEHEDSADDNTADVRLAIQSVLVSLSILRGDQLPTPKVLVDQRNYSMVVQSAEFYAIREQESEDGKSDNMLKLNQDYQLLGRILSGQISSDELKNISLSKLVNLTILLCQSQEGYKDFGELMNLYPAKWKIVLRCVQELMQGCPRNILYVMQKDSFWLVHEGCAGLLHKIATRFLGTKTKTKNMTQILTEENRRRGRPASWGIYTLQELREPSVKNNYLLQNQWIMWRNPKNVGDFIPEMDALLLEMEADEAAVSAMPKKKKKDRAIADTQYADTISSDFFEVSDYHSLAFVNDALDAWKERDRAQQDGAPQNSSPLRNEEDALCSRISEKFDEQNDAEVRRDCITLGLNLFEQRYAAAGNTATEEAINILRETVSCISTDVKTDIPLQKIRVAVHNVLYSAPDWESLLASCKSWLVFLCKLIDDVNTRQSYADHIRLIQDIGTELSRPMTSQERIDYIKEKIKACHANPSTLDRDLKQALINLLNAELIGLQNQALITLEIYPSERDLPEDMVTGMVRNLGQQTVTNLTLELRIDDVCVSRAVLDKMPGGSSIPFGLNHGCDEDCSDVGYQIVLQYNTQDGRTEMISASGMLHITDEDIETPAYAFFATGTPAEGAEYVERTNLQKYFKIWYAPTQQPDALPSLAVFGMRRMGKSSLLKWLYNYIRENFGDKVLAVGSDLERVGNFTSLTQRVQHCLIDCIFTDIAITDPSVKNEAWTTLKEKWSAPLPESDNFDWITDFFLDLKTCILGERQLVLLLDEIEALYMTNKKSLLANEAPASYEDVSGFPEENDTADDAAVALPGQTNLWNALSSITQDKKYGVTLILCGSDAFTNTIWAGDNMTQFFGRVEKTSVGRMTPSEIESALRQIEARSDVRYHRDTIDYLYSLVGGLPWHSKNIVNKAIMTRLTETDGTVLYPYDILCAAERVYTSDLDVSLNNMGMGAASKDEKRFLSLLAEATETAATWVPKSLLREQFLRESTGEDAADRFEKTVRMLVDRRQMIIKRRSEQEEEYRFGSEFNRLFVKQQAPIPRFILKY